MVATTTLPPGTAIPWYPATGCGNPCDAGLP